MDKTRRRGVVFMAAAAILAMLAAVMFSNYLSELEAQAGEKIKVVAAKTNIPARTLIAQDMIEMREIPKKYALSSYLLDVKDVTEDTIALVNISAGDILQRNTIDRNAGLDPGMRAVSMDVNRVQSVGGSIRPGNRVDIVASFEDNVNGQPVDKTVLLFQDVLVLGVSTLAEQVATPTPAAEGETAGPTPTPIPQTLPAARYSPSGRLLSEASVTVALPVEDALKLVYMNNFGKDVRFLIRRIDETQVPPIPPVSADTFK
jgi:pilus assembly protein CpaB